MWVEFWNSDRLTAWTQDSPEMNNYDPSSRQDHELQNEITKRIHPLMYPHVLPLQPWLCLQYWHHQCHDAFVLRLHWLRRGMLFVLQSKECSRGAWLKVNFWQSWSEGHMVHRHLSRHARNWVFRIYKSEWVSAWMNAWMKERKNDSFVSP